MRNSAVLDTDYDCFTGTKVATAHSGKKSPLISELLGWTYCDT